MTAIEAYEKIDNKLWSEIACNKIGIKEFEKLDTIVAELELDPEAKKEFFISCNVVLEGDNKKSIIARYLSSLCGRHPVDDRAILTVLEDYYNNEKWEEVLFLANKILSFNENPFALYVLGTYYEKKGNLEEKIETWKRLVKVNFDDTDIVNRLADYFSQKGEVQNALNYYRILIRRQIKLEDYSALKKTWEKVMNLKSDNGEYLINLACGIADAMGGDKGLWFFNSIVDKGNFPKEINVKALKNAIKYAPDSLETRDRIVALWKEIYKDNPRLDYCLKNTGILNDYQNISTSIDKFELEISFVEKAFVYHSTWRIGRIQQILQDDMIINFSSKGVHRMSCDMAFKSLKVLPKTHIWVLKAAVSRDRIREKLLNDTNWGLNTLLSSFDNKMGTIKMMKEELVPSLLSDEEWASWLTKARKELSSNPYYGIAENDPDSYTLRTTPITAEEKERILFKNATTFKERYGILKDFLDTNCDTDSNEFSYIISYFERTSNQKSDEGLWAYLVADHLKYGRKKLSFIDIKTTFEDHYTREAFIAQFKAIKEADIKRYYVNKIIDTEKKPQDLIISLYPLYPVDFMEKAITSTGKKTIMNEVRASAITKAKDYPEFFLYMVKNTSKENWKKSGVNENDILITKLQVLNSVVRKISNSIDVTENKKWQKLLIDSLFKGGEKAEVIAFINNASEEEVQKIYSVIKGINGIDGEKIAVKHKISTKFPQTWESICGEVVKKEQEKFIPKGLLCTRKSLDGKLAELDHLKNVEIPENAKEIGEARALGDLRENAEYQYGKDKQKNLNFMLNKLTDEVSKAQVVTPESVDTSFVSFGTKVVFMDNNANKNVTYTIMGPWESDPTQNILNFKAPLGQKLYNLKVGENTKFSINGTDYDYTVVSIEKTVF